MALAVDQGIHWLQAGLKAVSGETCVRAQCASHAFAQPPALLALGKAAGAMLAGALQGLAAQGLAPASVFGVTKAGHWAPWQAVIQHHVPTAQLLEGGHPLPDERSLAAGTALKAWIDALPACQPVLALLSGGASALVEQLKPGVTLAQWRALNQWLLGSGWSIEQINRIRAQFSQLKGGGLARLLQPRPVEGWVISDIPQADIRWVASGPLTCLPPPDSTAWAQLPEAFSTVVSLARHHENETVPLRCLKDNTQAQKTVVKAAAHEGVQLARAPALMTGAVETVAEAVLRWRQPVVLGGEPTVKLPQMAGQGGRNQHLCLLMAKALAGTEGWFVSLGTDGTDGNTTAAGAWVDGTTWQRAEHLGLNPQQALETYDSHRIFKGLGQLLETGPTGTNVMDLMLYCPPKTC